MSDADQAISGKIRAAFFIDGFNLYHAIDGLGQPHLKWVSYWKLSNILIPKSTQQLVGVTWCTARHPSSSSKAARHDVLVRAQKLEGVTVQSGHFVDERRDCRTCSSTWQHPSEKEGDINVAIHLLRDAFHDLYDHAYLVTADSDQVATVRMFMKEFPRKSLTVVVPPGRKRSEHLHNVAGKTIQMNDGHLDRSAMREIVVGRGPGHARRPVEYAPPAGWVHPDDRPKKAL